MSGRGPCEGRALARERRVLACDEQLVENVVRLVEIEYQIQLAHIAKVAVEYLRGSWRQLPCCWSSSRTAGAPACGLDALLWTHLDEVVDCFEDDQLVVVIVHAGKKVERGVPVAKGPGVRSDLQPRCECGECG